VPLTAISSIAYFTNALKLSEEAVAPDTTSILEVCFKISSRSKSL